MVQKLIVSPYVSILGKEIFFTRREKSMLGRVCLVVFPVNKIQRPYITKFQHKNYMNVYDRIMDIWRKVLKIELSFSSKGTCTRP